MTEKEIRKQIIENLEDIVFVEAGAGAGKTTLIVNRIINQLKHGFEPKEIVVITFTNAAAEELRSRIIKGVRDACKMEELSEEEHTCLTNALLKLDMMNISTIHSFCLKLLKERIFDAHLPMNTSLLEETKAQKQQTAIFTEWISSLDSTHWDMISQCGRDRSAAVKKIRTFFNAICELPDDITICYNQNAKDCEQEAKQLVEEFAKELCAVYAGITGKDSVELKEIPKDCLGTAKDGGQKFQEKMLRAKVPYFEIINDYSKKALPNFFAKSISKAEQDACKDWWRVTAKARIQNLKMEREDYEYGILLNYAVKAREAYRDKRPIENVSNDDLLQKTHRLICKCKEARDYFADRIRCIYVDEFQDTDHIQAEFIWSLAATKEDQTKLRNEALFLVGDPKQSIYRFRGAEPEVYFDTKVKMNQLSNARVYSLDYNFRSNEKIIQWVNSSFKNRQITSKEPYRPMIAEKKLPNQQDEKTLAGVYYYQEPEGNSTNYEKDAKDLSILIQQLVTKPYQIVDYKDKEPYERPISYSDILVLCNRKDMMDQYLKKMSEYGIPVQIYGSMNLAEHQALGNYVRIYDYLTHSYDSAKKAGALEAMTQSSLTNVEKMLDVLLQKTKGMSVYGIAEYLLHRIDVLMPNKKEISRAEILSAQTKLQQMFENVLSESEVSSEALSEAFWNYCEGVLERELSLEESGNHVRFMNLHKAKGLEGQIVILAKRDENIDFREGAVRKGSSYYPAYNGGRYVKWSSYRKDSKILNEAKVQEAEEQTRLQYVAATRAKQALILMDSISDSCMFTGYPLKGEPEVRSVERIIREKEDKVIEGSTASIYAYENRIVEEQKCVYQELSPSGLEHRSSVRLTALQALSEKEKEQYQQKKRPTGNVVGTIMHRSLEMFIERWRVDFTRQPKELYKIMRGSVKQALFECSKDIEKAEWASYENFALKVLQCFADWAYEERIFVNAKEVYTEMTFSYYKEKMQLEEEIFPAWMNGTADLIIQNKDGDFVVLDYKSDYAPYLDGDKFEQSLSEMYKNQLLEYRYAVSRLFDVKEEMVRLGILSFDGMDELIIRYTEINS